MKKRFTIPDMTMMSNMMPGTPKCPRCGKLCVCQSCLVTIMPNVFLVHEALRVQGGVTANADLVIRRDVQLVEMFDDVSLEGWRVRKFAFNGLEDPSKYGEMPLRILVRLINRELATRPRDVYRNDTIVLHVENMMADVRSFFLTWVAVDPKPPCE